MTRSVLDTDEPDVFEDRLREAISRHRDLDIDPLPAAEVLHRADHLRRRQRARSRTALAVGSIVVVLASLAAAAAIGSGRTDPDGTLTVVSEPPPTVPLDHVLLDDLPPDLVPVLAVSWTTDVGDRDAGLTTVPEVVLPIDGGRLVFPVDGTSFPSRQDTYGTPPPDEGVDHTVNVGFVPGVAFDPARAVAVTTEAGGAQVRRPAPPGAVAVEQIGDLRWVFGPETCQPTTSATGTPQTICTTEAVGGDDHLVITIFATTSQGAEDADPFTARDAAARVTVVDAARWRETVSTWDRFEEGDLGVATPVVSMSRVG